MRMDWAWNVNKTQEHLLLPNCGIITGAITML